jgi:hypothetical protein
MTTREIRAEALARAQGGQSWVNFPAIMAGFTEKGIPEQDILPRENVLTFQAWKALGRHVRRGEHGVRVVTWITTDERRDAQTGELIRQAGRRPWTAVVFHVSQTEPDPVVVEGAV